MHDECLDWDGHVTRVDTAEYDYETMDKKILVWKIHLRKRLLWNNTITASTKTPHWVGYSLI